MIDVLRKNFKLKDLLEVWKLSKSSYFYLRTALSQPDEYAPGERAEMWTVFLTHLDRPNLEYLDTIFDADVTHKKTAPRLPLSPDFS